MSYGLWVQKKSKKDPKFVRREMKKLQYAKVGKYYYLEKLNVPASHTAHELALASE